METKHDMERNTRSNRVRIFTQTSVEATTTGAGLALQRDESPVAPTHLTQIQPATSAAQADLGTTRAGRRRQRIKWTNEMNEHVLRCYYTATHCESLQFRTAYRRSMFTLFTDRYGNFEGRINENNLARRKDAIIINKYVEPDRQQRLSSEVAAHLAENETASQVTQITQSTIDMAQLEQEAQEVFEIEIETTQATSLTTQQQVSNNNANMQLTSLTTQQTPNNNENMQPTSSEVQHLKDLFNSNSIQFTGLDPLVRPRIPKAYEAKKLDEILKIINSEVLPHHLYEGIELEHLNSLIYVSAVTALKHLGKNLIPTSTNSNNNTSPFVPRWRKRLETRINTIRKDIGRLTAFKNGYRSSRLCRHIKRIISPQQISTVLTNQITEILDRRHQKLLAYTKRLKRYVECSNRKVENALFKQNQRIFYRRFLMKSETNHNPKYPPMEETERFWEGIWSNAKPHNENAHWVSDEIERMNHIIPMRHQPISKDEVTKIISQTSNWKSPGVDQLHNIWIKRLEKTHEHLARCFNNILLLSATCPQFFTTGLTYLLPKGSPCEDPSKYRPITCLTTSYKLFTRILADRIYNHCSNNNIMSEEQKGCKRGSMGCKDQLISDSVITGLALKKKRNLSMAFIDYQKAFDSMPHSYLTKVLEIYKIDPIIIDCLKNLMAKWNTRLCQRKSLSKPICIRRGIFQGDSLSTLWFCIGLNPLSNILSKAKSGFTIRTETFDQTINHLLYVDDLKLYSNKREKLHQMIEIVKSFSSDIAMEFGIEKCKTIHLLKGKIDEEDEGFQIDENKIIEEMQHGDSYKYLGFLQLKGINHTIIKGNLTSNFRTRLKIILKSNLNGGNKVKAINTWAIPLLTYSFGVIKWSLTDISRLERITRTTMTKYRSHHPNSAIERTTLPRNLGGLGITDLGQLHYDQVTNLRQYFRTSDSSLLKAVVLADKEFTPLNLCSDISIQPTPTMSIDQKLSMWKSKPIHGVHPHDLHMDHIDQRSSNIWLINGKLFSETEGFIMAIQDRVIATRNYLKFVVKEAVEDKCRRCGQNGETIEHIISGCSAFASYEYTHRHNNVAKLIHQQLALDNGLITEHMPYYKYQPVSVLENSTKKLYWDRTITTDQHIPANRPDVILFHKIENRIEIFDIAVTLNRNLQSTYSTKISKYAALAIELRAMHNAETVRVNPIVISATGLIPKILCSNLEKFKLEHILAEIQKSVLLDTCNIVRKFMNI